MKRKSRNATTYLDQATRTQQAIRAFHEEVDLVGVIDRRLVARLWPFIRPHRVGLLLSLSVLVVIAGLSVSRPLIMRSGFEGTDVASLTRAGFALLAVILIEQILTFVQAYSMQVVGARAMHDLRCGVFEFLHEQRLQFFERRPIGRLVTRVTNDTDAIGELFASGALNALGDVIRLVGIVSLMLLLDWRMSLIAFALLPPIGFLVEMVRRQARKALRKIRAKLAQLNTFVNEQVQGVSVVQSFRRESQCAKEFDEINVSYRNQHYRAIALESSLDAAVEMISSICIASVLWYAGMRSLGAHVSFGTLVAFVAYIEQFFVPIRDLSSRYTLFQSAMAGAERVFDLLDHPEPDAIVDRPDGRPIDSRIDEHRDEIAEDHSDDLAFELNDVTFGYRPNVDVLRGISLKIRTGEKVALVGASGSGKTTIASLLLRLYDVDQGVVRVQGRDVRSVPREQVRSHFSVVPHELYLFPGTIASNVAVGDPNPDRVRIEQVLRRVGGGDIIDEREDGIDARIEERGANLSVGQRQLVAFARAMYRDAPILLLDEATASVDSTTEARVHKGLLQLIQGRTALIIAHRLWTVRQMDRIVVLQKGMIVEQGTHDELVARGGLYAKLYTLQTSHQQDAQG